MKITKLFWKEMYCDDFKRKKLFELKSTKNTHVFRIFLPMPKIQGRHPRGHYARLKQTDHASACMLHSKDFGEFFSGCRPGVPSEFSSPKLEHNVTSNKTSWSADTQTANQEKSLSLIFSLLIFLTKTKVIF